MNRSRARGTDGGTENNKAEAVHGLFDSIAPRYDLLNRLLSAGQDGRWRRKAVAMFGPEVKLVIDVATGTGDLSLAWLAERPGAEVLAEDFVHAMCIAARDKLSDVSGALGVIRADALNLPLANESCDGVMAAFGVRNFANLERGLSEMARVLRPGGEIMVLEFFPSWNPVLELLFRVYFRHILPRLGGLISGRRDAYEYLPRSVEDFVSRRRFDEILESLGFAGIRRREFNGGIATAVHARFR